MCVCVWNGSLLNSASKAVSHKERASETRERGSMQRPAEDTALAQTSRLCHERQKGNIWYTTVTKPVAEKRRDVSTGLPAEVLGLALSATSNKTEFEFE